jgi:6-pyruvoyltetrahydropterin/6-carboxytetrahydropterin synthase
MLVDFGIIKEQLHDLVDSFDHTTMLWNRLEDAHITQFFVENFERVIVAPFNTTAEMQATFFYTIINKLLKKWKRKNDVSHVNLDSVRIHETDT